ncbi:VWA domain-containing protein [Streptomyces sp. NPDC054813]
MITSAPSAPRVRASATALFLTAAMFLGASAPRADDRPAAPSPDDICRSLHVDDVPASYVVLVDTSSSMEDRGPDGATQYDTVRKRLRTFLAGLGPSDQVALVSFGRSVGVVHPLGPAAGARDAVDDLPARATETASDPGSALETAADQLRDSRTPVAAVLLLTDGAINAPDSAYAKLGSPSWRRLGERYRTLGEDRTVVGYGLPLADDTHVSDILGAVVATPRILPVGAAALGTQLNSAKDRVRTDKAVRTLRDDAGAGVRLSLTDDTAGTGTGSDALDLGTGDREGARRQTVRLTVTSTAHHVPLRVRLRARTDGGGPSVSSVGLPDEAVTLEPGARRTYHLTLLWRQDPRPALAPSTKPFETGLAVSAEVTSSWTPTVHGALGYPGFRLAAPATARVRLHGQVPGEPPVWLYPVLLVLVLGGVLAGWTAYRRRNHPLSGTLVITDLRSGDRVHHPLDGRLFAKDIEVAQVRARVRVRGRGPAGRTVLAVECVREPVRANAPRLADSGQCELGKSTVLCGIGFSHTSDR